MERAGKVDLRVYQEEIAKRLATRTAAEVESSRLAVACADALWLVRLADAGEVIAMPAIAPVPLTKHWFLGLANIRGSLYSIVDFAGFLGQEEAPPHAAGGTSRAILFGPRAGELRAGIVVPRVLGLSSLAALAPAAPPPDAPAWYGPRWIDADGAAWQEIDLVALARDPAFLQVAP
jgi:twitching motility protein PilI